MKRLLIIFLFFPTCSCMGQEIDKIRGASWISIDYIKQMENHLPCECGKSENYTYYISIASKDIEETDIHGTRIPELIFNRIIQTDGARQFYIISEDSNKYVITEDYQKSNSALELELVKDTLLILENGEYRKFIKSDFSFEYHTDGIYSLDNIVLLNKSLTLRGYPPIESILKADSLGLVCNGWNGEINLVFSKKQGKSWIVEINNGYLFVKKITNQQRDTLDKIKTKVIKKLKWDIL